MSNFTENYSEDENYNLTNILVHQFIQDIMIVLSNVVPCGAMWNMKMKNLPDFKELPADW